MGQIFSSSKPDPLKSFMLPGECHDSSQSYVIHVDRHRDVQIKYLGKPQKGLSPGRDLSTELALLKDAVARAITVNSTDDVIEVASIDVLTQAGRMLDIWLTVLKPVPALALVYAHMDALLTLLTALKKFTYSPPKGFSPPEKKEKSGSCYGEDYFTGSVSAAPVLDSLFRDSIVKFCIAIEKYASVTRTGKQINPVDMDAFGVRREFTLLRNSLVHNWTKDPPLYTVYGGAMYALSWFDMYFWPNLSADSSNRIIYRFKFGAKVNLRQEYVYDTVDFSALIRRRKRALKVSASKVPSPDANEVANFLMRELKARKELPLTEEDEEAQVEWCPDEEYEDEEAQDEEYADEEYEDEEEELELTTCRGMDPE